MKNYEIQSAEHFINIIRFIRKKRKQSTYIFPAFLDLLKQTYELNPLLCSEYIQYLRQETTNSTINHIHMYNFIKEYVSLPEYPVNKALLN